MFVIRSTLDHGNGGIKRLVSFWSRLENGNIVRLPFAHSFLFYSYKSIIFKSNLLPFFKSHAVVVNIRPTIKRAKPKTRPIFLLVKQYLSSSRLISRTS